MKKRTHIIFAAICTFLFIYLTVYLGFSWFEFTWKSIAITSLIIVVYSILPDLDHKNSTITWLFLGIGILGLVSGLVVFWLGLARPNPITVITLSTLFIIFTFIAGNYLKHRGIVHTVQAGIIAAFPTYIIFHSIVYPVLAYIVWHSHLLGDGFLFKIR